MSGVLQILGIRHHLLLPDMLLVWCHLVAVLYAEQWDLIPSKREDVTASQNVAIKITVQGVC